MIGSVTDAETRIADAEWVSASTAPNVPPAATAEVLDQTQPDRLPDDRYLNRELSWLDFNARVLAPEAYI